MKLLVTNKTYTLFMTFAFLVLTSQTCKQVLPTSCEDVEIFYGPLVETYGPASDGTNQMDRFYLGNLYYKSSNSDLKAIRINFDASYLETVNASSGISTSSSPAELVLQKSGNANLPNTGNDFSQLATIAWRVKYTDFDNVFGKQKFTFFDDSNLSFSSCQPSYIDPPMLYTFNSQKIDKPVEGYTPASPIVQEDVKISNNGQPSYLCVNEGKLMQQVSNINECTYKHLEITYQYMNANEIPLKMLRNDVIPREAIERILRVNKGTYNGDAWWCDNGDIISSKFCKSCGTQNTCRKLTFKM